MLLKIQPRCMLCLDFESQVHASTAALLLPSPVGPQAPISKTRAYGCQLQQHSSMTGAAPYSCAPILVYIFSCNNIHAFGGLGQLIHALLILLPFTSKEADSMVSLLTDCLPSMVHFEWKIDFLPWPSPPTGISSRVGGVPARIYIFRPVSGQCKKF